MYTLVYSIENDEHPKTVYINLTNACTNDCVFCLRSQKDDVCGAEMWHDDNYTLNDIIEQFNKFQPTPSEVVFCGYGEPFLKKDMMKAFALYLRKNYPQIKIRVNTNGHANAVYKDNVAEEFKDLIDEASISLNSDNPNDYDEICRPKIENAYEAVKDFITSCNNAGIKTIASIVTDFDKREINVNNCEIIAKQLGAEFKNRKYIPNGY
ncbi:MAG: TatD family nuclease-associated radical SAM protein [bacterium]|nr:TatD family nuclease-associated radical SAM protein [bacterium]